MLFISRADCVHLFCIYQKKNSKYQWRHLCELGVAYNLIASTYEWDTVMHNFENI